MEDFESLGRCIQILGFETKSSYTGDFLSICQESINSVNLINKWSIQRLMVNPQTHSM